MMSIRSLTLVFLLSAATIAAAQQPQFDTGMIPAPLILIPQDAPKAMIVLVSDGTGWTSEDQAEATRLNTAGAIVVGIDTPKYLASLAKDDGDCIYTISDIESLSQQLQRATGNSAYLTPIVAGIGEGGALAQAMLAQTPKATIGQTLAIDPAAGIPLTREFCTPAAKQVTGERMVYGLTDGDLPDPFTAIFTAAAPAEGKAHIRSLLDLHGDIDMQDSDSQPRAALSGALDGFIAALQQSDAPLGMPLSILETAPRYDTMAVVYSGDGGWRDIDQEVGAYLQQEGIPVVGLDALRYFWTERSPTDTAADLDRIISTYRKHWKVHHVLLIGYSFGADVLPASFNLLPEATRKYVSQISLLALSHELDYEISVAGWLGAASGKSTGDPLDDVRKIDPKIVQCIYGKDEDDDQNGCPDLKPFPAEIIGLEGGHHFDGDYDALTKLIVDSLKAKLGR